MSNVNATTAMARLKSFMQDEEAATAAEYGILAALVACAIIVAVNQFGSSLKTMFTNLSQHITSQS